MVLAAAGCSASVSTPKPAATQTLRPYLPPTVTSGMTPPPLEPSSEATSRPSATPFMHTVQKDETLLAIAARYGISLEMLLAANPGINPRLLSIGQQLTIPGPEGGQLIPELPTTTPVAVRLSDVRCYATLSRGLTCLASVSNPGDDAVEGVVVRFTLLTDDPETSQSAEVFTPLNLMPPGGTLPLSASFPTPSNSDYTIGATLLGAIPAAHPEERYADVMLSEQESTSSIGGSSWTISGKADVSRPFNGELRRLVVLAMAFDAEDAIIGFAETELDASAAANGPIAYELRVFSLGPPIARIQVTAEASTSE